MKALCLYLYMVLFVFQNFTNWNLDKVCFWRNLAGNGLSGITHFQALSSMVQPCEQCLLSSSLWSSGEEKEALPESRKAFEVTPFFVCKHPFFDKPMVRTEPAEPSARLLQWRTKILGTVMENHPSTSLTYQIFRRSIICTSLTTWTPRLALPFPLQTMAGWTNTFTTRQSVQGCTNYNTAWGRGGKGEN